MRSIVFSLVIIILSCNNSNVRATKETIKKSYEQTINDYLAGNPVHAKTFLQFDLGGSRKSNQQHLVSLIKSGKIEDRSTLEFSTLNTKIEGYPYQLWISKDTMYKTFFDLSYKRDTLYAISMLPYGDVSESSIKDFLDQQYGPPSYSKYDSTRFKDRYYWFKNDYEISYLPSPLEVISFSDLRIKKRVLANDKLIDSITNEVKKELPKETKKDFQ